MNRKKKYIDYPKKNDKFKSCVSECACVCNTALFS